MFRLNVMMNSNPWCSGASYRKVYLLEVSRLPTRAMASCAKLANRPSFAKTLNPMSNALFSPLFLPNGTVLPNRLAKAAMEENMADPGQLPGDALCRLYTSWAKGGAGLVITGNVMVDPRAMTGPGGVVLQSGTELAPFKRWVAAAGSGGAQVWMQINHPGRQVLAAMGQPGWAPSAVALDLGKHSRLIAKPQEMSDAEIVHTITRFANTAKLAQKAGFHGVQVHAAHGYLLSQFLSPLANKRTDKWGGSLENRARFLLQTVRAVRAVVKPEFCVAVKLNSADFQRGGFDAADAQAVVQMLNDCAVDLVELSGGSYEAPAMQGEAKDGRTLAREAYFLEFARDIAKVALMPVMVTGGIRRQAVAQEVLAQGVAMVGMATALALNPSLPNAWREGQSVDGVRPAVGLKDKVMAALATMAIVKRQLQRLGAAKRPKANVSPVFSLLRDQLRTRWLTRRYRRWVAVQ
jgi:2,4-dienoyl-CoA reductase-like NADH-dependent reductase (Old Yellow Enzyme family)